MRARITAGIIAAALTITAASHTLANATIKYSIKY